MKVWKEVELLDAPGTVDDAIKEIEDNGGVPKYREYSKVDRNLLDTPYCEFVPYNPDESVFVRQFRVKMQKIRGIKQGSFISNKTVKEGEWKRIKAKT